MAKAESSGNEDLLVGSALRGSYYNRSAKRANGKDDEEVG